MHYWYYIEYSRIVSVFPFEAFAFTTTVSPPYTPKGVDFKTKEIKVNSKLINLTIWDTGNKIINRCTDIENCFVKACISFDIGE